MTPMIAAGLALALAAAPCRVEDAHYLLRTTTNVTASFRDVESGRDWPGRLAFGIHFGATGRTYWFLPFNGGTDGLQKLASTTDVEAPGWTPPSPDGGPRPLGEFATIATDAAYTVIGDIPRRDGRAPAHILIPRLGDAVGHGPDVNVRDSAPTQFFDLVKCGKDQ